MTRLFTACAVSLLSVISVGVTLADREVGTALPIIVPPEASVRVLFAANELSHYVKAITGMILPVRSDGQASVAVRLEEKGADDAFHIKCTDQGVAIIGGRRGVLYGVYELLERFGGCVWLSSDFEIVPPSKRLEVPDGFDFSDAPAFEERRTTWYDLKCNPKFAAKLRVTQPRAPDELGGPAFPCDRVLSEAHTFFRLVPPNEFFDSHPEYFSEIDGKRVNDAQLCLSNADVLDIAVRRTLERIRANYPMVKTYGISQNDGASGACECPSCKVVDAREGSHAGTVIDFVNKIAEAVEREFPDVTIETLAYTYTRVPPKTICPRRNVMPCLCSYECDRSKPFAESRCSDSVAFCSNLVRWAAISEKLRVWDYATEFLHYTAPHPNVVAFRRNLEFLKKNKVRRVLEQGNSTGPHGDFSELKAWLLAKWMWNPSLDQDRLLQRFLDGYYGAAAPVVREYFVLLHSMPVDESRKPVKCFLPVNSSFYSEEFFRKASDLWRQAKACVKGDPDRERHVAWGAFNIDVSRVERYLGREGFRFFNLSRKPRSIDAARFREMRDLAKSLLPMLDSCPEMRLAENTSLHARHNAFVRTLAAMEEPCARSDTVRLPPWIYRRPMRFLGRGSARLEEYVLYDVRSHLIARLQFRRRNPRKAARFVVKLKGRRVDLETRIEGGDLVNDSWKWLDVGRWVASGDDTLSFDAENVEVGDLELTCLLADADGTKHAISQNTGHTERKRK